MASFYVKAVGMTIARRRRSAGIELPDGAINITINPMRETGPKSEPAPQGITRIGFTVENEACCCLYSHQ
ncbi:MAG: hypothetical protein V3S73_02225 [Gammaproteobacteria bacterium]